MFAKGDQIGSYTVTRRLGAGGMGEVYLAEHRHIDRKTAIKVLLPELSGDEEIIARFFTEARAASRIKHPGIVEILDCEIDARGRAYIAMEFLEGESLGSALGRVGRFDAGSALGIIGQIAAALAAAHAKGIIHRDLKPDNVFLASTPEGEAALLVKVLDFGIAKLVADGRDEKRKTRTGSLIGTPLYMSPEQCRGAGTIDHRTDIYSLGCIAFETITGRPPFVREGAGELIAAHLGEAPPDIALHQPSIQPELGALIMSMLAKDPGARPQGMTEVVRAIEAFLGTTAAHFAKIVQPPDGFPATPADDDAVAAAEPSRAPSRSVPRALAGNTRVLADAGRRAPAQATTLSQTASELTTPTRPPPRPRIAWLVAIPAAVVLVGVGVFVASRPGPPVAAGGGPPRPEPTQPTAVAAPPAAPPPVAPPPAGDVVVPAIKVDPANQPEQPSPPRKRKPLRPAKPAKPARNDGKDYNYIPE